MIMKTKTTYNYKTMALKSKINPNKCKLFQIEQF